MPCGLGQMQQKNLIWELPGTDVMIFKKKIAEKFSEKIGFFDSIKW
jgi:hypothetical protein